MANQRNGFVCSFDFVFQRGCSVLGYVLITGLAGGCVRRPQVEIVEALS